MSRLCFWLSNTLKTYWSGTPGIDHSTIVTRTANRLLPAPALRKPSSTQISKKKKPVRTAMSVVVTRNSLRKLELFYQPFAITTPRRRSARRSSSTDTCSKSSTTCFVFSKPSALTSLSSCPNLGARSCHVRSKNIQTCKYSCKNRVCGKSCKLAGEEERQREDAGKACPVCGNLDCKCGPTCECGPRCECQAETNQCSCEESSATIEPEVCKSPSWDTVSCEDDDVYPSRHAIICDQKGCTLQPWPKHQACALSGSENDNGNSYRYRYAIICDNQGCTLQQWPKPCVPETHGVSQSSQTPCQDSCDNTIIAFGCSNTCQVPGCNKCVIAQAKLRDGGDRSAKTLQVSQSGKTEENLSTSVCDKKRTVEALGCSSSFRATGCGETVIAAVKLRGAGKTPQGKLRTSSKRNVEALGCSSSFHAPGCGETVIAAAKLRGCGKTSKEKLKKSGRDKKIVEALGCSSTFHAPGCAETVVAAARLRGCVKTSQEKLRTSSRDSKRTVEALGCSSTFHAPGCGETVIAAAKLRGCGKTSQAKPVSGCGETVLATSRGGRGRRRSSNKSDEPCSSKSVGCGKSTVVLAKPQQERRDSCDGPTVSPGCCNLSENVGCGKTNLARAKLYGCSSATQRQSQTGCGKSNVAILSESEYNSKSTSYKSGDPLYAGVYMQQHSLKLNTKNCGISKKDDPIVFKDVVRYREDDSPVTQTNSTCKTCTSKGKKRKAASQKSKGVLGWFDQKNYSTNTTAKKDKCHKKEPPPVKELKKYVPCRPSWDRNNYPCPPCKPAWVKKNCNTPGRSQKTPKREEAKRKASKRPSTTPRVYTMHIGNSVYELLETSKKSSLASGLCSIQKVLSAAGIPTKFYSDSSAAKSIERPRQFEPSPMSQLYSKRSKQAGLSEIVRNGLQCVLPTNEEETNKSGSYHFVYDTPAVQSVADFKFDVCLSSQEKSNSSDSPEFHSTESFISQASKVNEGFFDQSINTTSVENRLVDSPEFHSMESIISQDGRFNERSKQHEGLLDYSINASVENKLVNSSPKFNSREWIVDKGKVKQDEINTSAEKELVRLHEEKNNASKLSKSRNSVSEVSNSVGVGTRAISVMTSETGVNTSPTCIVTKKEGTTCTQTESCNRALATCSTQVEIAAFTCQQQSSVHSTLKPESVRIPTPFSSSSQRHSEHSYQSTAGTSELSQTTAKDDDTLRSVTEVSSNSMVLNIINYYRNADKIPACVATERKPSATIATKSPKSKKPSSIPQDSLASFFKNNQNFDICRLKQPKQKKGQSQEKSNSSYMMWCGHLYPSISRIRSHVNAYHSFGNSNASITRFWRKKFAELKATNIKSPCPKCKSPACPGPWSGCSTSSNKSTVCAGSKDQFVAKGANDCVLCTSRLGTSKAGKQNGKAGTLMQLSKKCSRKKDVLEDGAVLVENEKSYAEESLDASTSPDTPKVSEDTVPAESAPAVVPDSHLIAPPVVHYSEKDSTTNIDAASTSISNSSLLPTSNRSTFSTINARSLVSSTPTVAEESKPRSPSAVAENRKTNDYRNMYPPGLKPSPVKSAACITLQEPIQTTRFYSTRSYGGQSRCTNNSKASWLQPKEAEPGSSSWLSLPKVKPARPKTRNQPYKPTRPAWLKEDECVSESESQVSFSSAVTHLSDVTSEIKVKERKDLIHQLDLFDKEKCEGEINAYFGDGYKNKQYHRYSDMTYLNLVGHLKKYRQKQPGDN